MKTLLILCIAGLGLCSLKTDKVSHRDRKFAEKATMASLREIKLGKLAQSQSSSPAVQALGRDMVTDHTLAHNRMKALADKKGITLPTEMCSRDAKNYAELAQLKGSEFDQKFAKCAQKDHEKVFKMYKCEAKHGKSDDFMTYASDIGFKVERHVTQSEAVAAAVKKNDDQAMKK